MSEVDSKGNKSVDDAHPVGYATTDALEDRKHPPSLKPVRPADYGWKLAKK